MSTLRLFTAAARVDDYFAGRLGAIVPDETRREILAELSAAVAEAKTREAHRSATAHTLNAALYRVAAKVA